MNVFFGLAKLVPTALPSVCVYWYLSRLPSCVFSFSQVSIVGIGHEFKTFDGEEVQQYIDLMDKDEIAEAPAADPAMQE